MLRCVYSRKAEETHPGRLTVSRTKGLKCGHAAEGHGRSSSGCSRVVGVMVRVWVVVRVMGVCGGTWSGGRVPRGREHVASGNAAPSAPAAAAARAQPPQRDTTAAPLLSHAHPRRRRKRSTRTRGLTRSAASKTHKNKHKTISRERAKNKETTWLRLIITNSQNNGIEPDGNLQSDLLNKKSTLNR